jgi:SAM-dependent methyltransferase
MSVFGEVSESDPMLAESPWDLERLKATADWLANHLHERDMRILDAGCATGTLIGLLQSHGFSNLVGLDPSPLAAATTSRHYAVDAIAGSFCSPPTTLGQFDVVLLSHVLEHIADVREAADGLASMVTPGGFVYLEVPDAARYSKFLIAPFHDFNNEHINHFSLNSLDMLLLRRGFERIEGGTKVVPIAPQAPYPAAFGLWKKTGVAREDIRFDTELRSGLGDYVNDSADLLLRIDSRLRDSLGDEPIALWGAGNLALKLLEDTVLKDLNVVAVVDGSRQRQGISLNGITVVAPDALKDFEGTVLVMSLHHGESIASSAKKLIGSKASVKRLLD